MKAAMLKAKGQPLTIEDIADPVPGAGEVVVRVLAAPVLSYTHEVFSGVRDYPLLLPLAPGCGAIGLVEKLGPDSTRLKLNQLVFCDPTVRSRDDSLSPDIMLQGWIAPGEGPQKLQTYFRNGSFAEKMLLPLENAIPLEGLEDAVNGDLVKLASLVTLLVPYGGLLATGFQAGQVLAITGATGNFGSAGVAVALAMGAARVVAPGRNEQMLHTLVSQFGKRVRPVLLTQDEALNSKRMREAAEGPIDCVLDLLPPLRDMRLTRSGIMAVRSGGTVILMGGANVDLPIPYKYVMRNSLVIRGYYMCPRHAPLLLAGLIRSGLLNLDLFSTHTFPLDQVNQAIEYARDHGKAFHQTVLQPTVL
jgi:alcohol dehydrogenase